MVLCDASAARRGDDGRDGGDFSGLWHGGVGGGATGETCGGKGDWNPEWDEKCFFVQDLLGVDDCIDLRTLDLDAALRAPCPTGIDVYFENVGVPIQHAIFAQLNPFARVVMCGTVSQYNETDFLPGPNLGFVVRERVRIEGLIVTISRRGLPDGALWRGPGSRTVN